MCQTLGFWGEKSWHEVSLIPCNGQVRCGWTTELLRNYLWQKANVSSNSFELERIARKIVLILQYVLPYEFVSF